MASKIKAINTYRPKLKLGRTASLKEVVQVIAGRTGLNEGEISIVLKELRDAVTYFALQGRSTKIEGLGTYRPKIGLDGRLSMTHLLDAEIKNSLNTPGAFNGDIENRQNIGKTGDDLVQQWNEAHPDDVVN